MCVFLILLIPRISFRLMDCFFVDRASCMLAFFLKKKKWNKMECFLDDSNTCLHTCLNVSHSSSVVMNLLKKVDFFGGNYFIREENMLFCTMWGRCGRPREQVFTPCWFAIVNIGDGVRMWWLTMLNLFSNLQARCRFRLRLHLAFTIHLIICIYNTSNHLQNLSQS